jgi:anti-anti-sigma regulatory factor
MDSDVGRDVQSEHIETTTWIDTAFYDHLSELVICCDDNDQILYANLAAQQQSTEPLIGQPFTTLLVPGVAHKGNDFLAAARAATPADPTPSWELSLGSSSSYVIANFRGYNNGNCIITLGEVEPERVSTMQREMLELTSELTTVQRQLQRQNRALQQSLAEQSNLLERIQEMSAPIAPILDGVLLLPLVGHIDSQRAQKINEELLPRVSASHARIVILDVTSIATIDTAVAHLLIDTAQALRLLGARAMLVGINPAIAETIVHLGVDLHMFSMHSDLQHAVAAVLHQRTRRFV